MTAAIQSKLQAALRAHQAGDRKAAESGYRAILRVDPRHVDALYLLGVLLHQAGRPADAIDPLTRAIRRAPHRAEFYNTLGDVYRVLGRFDEAIQEFQQALDRRAEFPEVQHNLARTLHAGGRTNDALVLLFSAVAAQPTNASLRRLLATMLQGVALHSGNELVRQVLRLLLTDEQVAAQSISGAVLGLVKSELDMSALLAAAGGGQDPFATCVTASSAVVSHPLLLTALPRFIVCDPELERIFTAMRTWMARRVAWRDTVRDELPQLDPSTPLEFVAALATQCANGEYAWDHGADEVAAAQRIADTLDRVLGALPADAASDGVVDVATLERLVALHALFAPLHALTHWRRMLEIPITQWSDTVRLLVQAQVFDEADEQQRAASMAAITVIRHEVSRDVRDMYESNPYPRWMAVPQATAMPVASLVQSLRPELTRPPSSCEVLVAGCGTGQQPIQLRLMLSDASMLAFDLSRRSLAYGARMADELGVTRIRFAQGDLLEFDDPGQRYAMISCSGVLHHLRDPMEGWRRLLAHLAPDGVMKIGLYSRVARRAVYAARTVLSEARGNSPADVSERGLRAARRTLLDLPMEHPARAVTLFTDFYSLSGVRDLVLHVQERDYTIRELAECLTQLNLRFLGFQLPQSVQVHFQERYGAERALDLAAWEEYEAMNPSTFAGMYQFWCCGQ